MSFKWDIRYDVIYEHYLFSSVRIKYQLYINYVYMHNVSKLKWPAKIIQGKFNIKEYFQYLMNHQIRFVIEVKYDDNIIESVQYLYDYIDALFDQVV